MVSIKKLIEEAKVVNTGEDIHWAEAIESSNTRQCLCSKKTVAVAKTVSPQSTIHKVGVSFSLGGSLSLPLAVVAKTVSTVVSSETVSVSQSVSSVAVEVRISSSLCLGFRLGGSDGRQGENYEHLHVGAG